MDSFGTRRPVVPLLVQDVDLKRARTEVNGEDAIRVSTGTGTVAINPQDIADGAGLVPTQIVSGSVNSQITNMNTKMTNMNTKINRIDNTLGETGDDAWAGAPDATVISLLKGIVNKL